MLRYVMLACSHRRHGQDKTVLSCPWRRCEHKCRQDKTVLSCLDPVSMSFVLSRPSFQFATVQSRIYWGLLKTWKLETGSRRDKLSCLVCSCVHTADTDKTTCRRCEQAMVTWLQFICNDCKNILPLCPLSQTDCGLLMRSVASVCLSVCLCLSVLYGLSLLNASTYRVYFGTQVLFRTSGSRPCIKVMGSRSYNRK